MIYGQYWPIHVTFLYLRIDKYIEISIDILTVSWYPTLCLLNPTSVVLFVILLSSMANPHRHFNRNLIPLVFRDTLSRSPVHTSEKWINALLSYRSTAAATADYSEYPPTYLLDYQP